MFTRDDIPKAVMIGVSVAVAAVAIVGTVAWFKRDQWDKEEADRIFDQLNNLYNDAIADHPTDRQKAKFGFELLASEIRAKFKQKYGKFSEYRNWERRFDEKVKHHKASILKA